MSVDDLRQQLRERGYLTHGIERWFALDPWSSRAFWLELATVCAKAAVLIGAFGMLPFVAIMLFRNRPLDAWETIAVGLAYGAALAVVTFALLALIALILKLRPALVIDTPRALLAIAFVASALLAAPLAIWWYRFDSSPSTPELLTGLGLSVIAFVVSTIAVSAALLSFSIYEVHRVPAIQQRSRTIPMTVAALVLAALLFLPAYAAREKTNDEPPLQVVTTPVSRRVALIAVDGLTHEIFGTRADLASEFASASPVTSLRGGSTAERWASVGTGVPPRIHGVHAIEGVRIRGGSHLMQNVSSADVVLRDAAVAIGLARREPLPPTVRRRDYIWELLARRAVISASVNWWTTDDVRSGALIEVGQASIFTAAKGDPVAVDAGAASRTLSLVDRDKPQLATVYLPALDVILNRVRLEPSAQLAQSVRALDALGNVVAELRRRGYEVVLVGLPGDRQSGSPVIASTVTLTQPKSAYDLAPTLCALFGFPASSEMIGTPLVEERQPRIATYGARAPRADNGKVNQEYYENLKSLGYIR